MDQISSAISLGYASVIDIEIMLDNIGDLSSCINNICSNNRLTLLCLACKLNRQDIVAMLLRKGKPNEMCPGTTKPVLIQLLHIYRNLLSIFSNNMLYSSCVVLVFE